MAKNPFPGMNPWLERSWADVHQAMVTYARDQLRPKLPPGLAARMQDRVFVDCADEQGHHVRSDPIRESYLELIDTAGGGRVVTVIEVLSHANKSGGEGQRLYLQKQRELREAGVSLVEIDLLRAGKRVTNAPPERLSRELRTPYQVCTLRGERPEIAEVYAVGLRDRIPAVRVPLRSTDPDVPLDIQSLVDQAYENGDYDLTIRYGEDPEPPLGPEDAAWADELLRSKGLR